MTVTNQATSTFRHEFVEHKHRITDKTVKYVFRKYKVSMMRRNATLGIVRSPSAVQNSVPALQERGLSSLKHSYNFQKSVKELDVGNSCTRPTMS